MQEVTKAHPIEIRFRSDIPVKVLAGLKASYGSWILPSDDEELVDWDSSDLSRSLLATMTPGMSLSGLRDAHGWTQKHLGGLLGVSAARISDWEHDRRAISKEIAKQLSKLFKVPADRFF